jgi:3-hydroxyisobutyrate dehydrogenase-like beta-hydroxyacid dehydrogenase
MDQPTIGFIGLGQLGAVIAANLTEKGRLHQVYNRTSSKTQPFTTKGVKAATTVTALASACDIVISIVTDDQAVRQLTEGPEGIAAHLRKGGIHISMSTILPSTATEMEQLHRRKGSLYLACPVIGRPEAAKARKLNFCLAGETAAKQQVKDLLTDAGAVNVWDYGENTGAANTAKLCCNFLIISAIESMAEALTLAEKSGVDKSTVMTMLGETIFNCLIYNNYGKAIVEEKFLPAGFTVGLGQKDVRLVKEHADTIHLSMPFADTLALRLANSVQAGHHDHDWTAITLDVKKGGL